MSDPQESHMKSIPLSKQIFFAVIIILFFFGSLELILSIFGVKPYTSFEDPFVGFSDSQPLYVEQTMPDGSTLMSTATYKTAYFNVQNFPKKKASNTFRIFSLGGSTTYGRPYTDSMSFSGWLRAFISEADPSHQWEVINAGGVSYASYRVAELMEELSQYEPDLFIIYTGQNEFLEKRTYEQIRDLPKFVVDLTEILAATRIYTVLKSTLDKTVFKSSDQARKKYQMTGEVKEILNETVGPSSYTRDDVLENDVNSHYLFNLKRMVKKARSVGSKIIFITPIANFKDMSPFKSQNGDGLSETERLSWEKLFDSGMNLMESGDTREAVSVFQKALAIDNRHAELNYRLGQALFKLERFDEAKESFQRAVDEDIAPLRILTTMRQALRSVANDINVPLVDFESILENIYSQEYGHTIFGEEYLIDHVHLTYQGYRLLALALLDELERQGTVKPTPAWNDTAVAEITQKMEEKIDSKMLAKSLLNLGNVMNWAGKQSEANEMYLQSYKLSGENATLIRLGYNASQMGDQNQALEYFKKVLLTDPDNLSAHDAITIIYKIQGRDEEAFKHYEKILEINPDNAEVHYKVAKRLLKLRKIDTALDHLKEAVRIDPDSTMMPLDLARTYIATGQIDKAAEIYENFINTHPDLASGHLDFGILKASTGEMEKAEQYFRKAVQLDPASEVGEYNLALALNMRGKIKEAIDHYGKVIAINPNFAPAYEDLAMIMKQQGKVKESEVYLSDARRIRQNEKKK